MKISLIILLSFLFIFPSLAQNISDNLYGTWKCFNRELINGEPDSLLYLNPSEYRDCRNFLKIDSLYFIDHWIGGIFTYYVWENKINLTGMNPRVFDIHKISNDTLIIQETKFDNIIAYRWSFYRTNETFPEWRKEEDSPIYTVVEQMPSYGRSKGEFEQFVKNHLKYSEGAKAQGVQGRVNIEIVLSKTGKVVDAKVSSAPRMDMAIQL
jgi:hypothetical protein